MRRINPIERIDRSIPMTFSRFEGMTCDEICSFLGINPNPNSKTYVRSVVDGMVDSNEFLDGLQKKAIRIDARNMCRESISLPSFNYEILTSQSWEESDLYRQLSQPHIFFIFRDERLRVESRFLGSVDFDFIPWMDSAKSVWEDTVDKIELSDYDGFMTEARTDMVFVRTHGRDSSDRIRAPDGSFQSKRSFWISKRFVNQSIVTRLSTSQQQSNRG